MIARKGKWYWHELTLLLSKGESYAGQYIPYIAHYMLEANNTDYFNVSGIQINDPSINEDSVMIYCKLVHYTCRGFVGRCR